MTKRCYTDKDTLATKKVVIKYGEIPVNNDKMRGTIKVVGFRKYKFNHEVDVTFEGEINVRIGRQLGWYDTSTQKTHNLSKVKLNRFLRKSSFKDVQARLRYFDAEIRIYSDINKIKWI